MENAVKNASSVENARTRQSIAASRNVLTVSGAIRRDARAREPTGERAIFERALA